MRSNVKNALCSAVAIAATIAAAVSLDAQESTKPTVPVTMTVTANIQNNKRMFEIGQQDVVVTQGKERLKVNGWIPAQGEYAGLDLFILIDDASDPSLGMHLDDLKNFINAQPSTTNVGVGYMRNATVQVLQDLTNDHAAAAKAVRLPLGSGGAYSSPYLSVIDLMKRWPDTDQRRREVLMVTDGVDRARRIILGRGLRINPDVDSASDVAMSTGTIIHTIYTPGAGRHHRKYWEATSGQMGLAKLSDVTGGESFFLGLQMPVSIAPYLDQLQNILDNQYLLTVSAQPGKKTRLQNVAIDTELAGVELASSDAVWVPAAK